MTPLAQSNADAPTSAVHVHAGVTVLDGLLGVPAGADGLVVFAHGSGSSRLSPRNRYVADALHHARIGTLLFDLLTEAEAAERRKVFDVALLGERLRDATTWLRGQRVAAGLGIGYFGASTGAAAALIAAADDETVQAVVSRGGRPDLAVGALPAVRAPTLFIVGGYDEDVLELNRRAYAQLRCERRLEIVAGATHLFEEPGTLDRVVELATGWFARHLRATRRTGEHHP